MNEFIKWLQGDFQHVDLDDVHRPIFFGETSACAEFFRTPSSSEFHLRAPELIKAARIEQAYGIHEATVSKLVAAWCAIHEVAQKLPRPVDQHTFEILQQSMRNLDVALGHCNSAADSELATLNETLGRSTCSLDEGLHQLLDLTGPGIGYWVVQDVLKRLRGLDVPSGRNATAAVLFYDESSRRSYVQWLTIELMELSSGSRGAMFPDLFSLGLTDVSDMNQPLQEVWAASQLSNLYHARWKLTSNDPDHRLNRPRYFSKFKGRSIQAAALSALWAAAGRIPRSHVTDTAPCDGYFQLNDERIPFRLNPRVVVSATLTTNAEDGEFGTEQMRLGHVGHALSKVEAAELYSRSQRPENSLFDTVIISTNDELPNVPSALEVRTDVTTIGEVLSSLLEVNEARNQWNQYHQDLWEKAWRLAHDADGKLLDHNGMPTDRDTNDDGGISTGSRDYRLSPWVEHAGAVDPPRNTQQTNTQQTESAD
ncbi:MAG: hypothetical protein KDB14_02280 [Planctomycetales bacterium]|nr:hypothetical protein [Planctomycetales bacterium]